MDTSPLNVPRHRRLLAGSALLLVLAAGAWAWQTGVWRQVVPASALTLLGRGDPLGGSAAAGETRIAVLEEGVPLTGGLVAGSVVPSRTQVAVLEPGAMPLTATARPERPLDDVTGLKLGTTLALLTQAYANGGVMARTLANVAHDLADQRAPGGLVDALMVLRAATPQVGPMTTVAMVAETQRLLSDGAPADLPSQAQADAAAAASSESWWQRQLERFVTIKRGNEPTTDRWTTQMRVAQQQLARGGASDGLLSLTTAPLSGDSRLDMLRGMVREYLDQQGKLTNAINAYAQAYLQQTSAGQQPRQEGE